MANPYRHNPTQILQATQTTGPEFYVAGGDFWLVCVAHAGGKWVLEFQDPADDTSWIALDIDFTANGAKILEGQFRLQVSNHRRNCRGQGLLLGRAQQGRHNDRLLMLLHIAELLASEAIGLKRRRLQRITTEQAISYVRAINTVIANRKDTTLNYKDYKKKLKVTLKRLRRHGPPTCRYGKAHQVIESCLK